MHDAERFDALAECFGCFDCGFGVDAEKDECELLAAVTCRPMLDAAGGSTAQCCRDLAQATVACQMAQMIIVLFEIIDVQK